MSEPEHKFEYELIDDEGNDVDMTPDLEINAHEKSRGAIGMLEWCRRAANEAGQYGFLPNGGCVEVVKAKVSLMIFEEGKWQSMMDMSMEMDDDDGFVKVSGKFPVTIT